jgi:hypothetical protein
MTLTTAGLEAIAGWLVGDASAGWSPLGMISIGTHATVPTTSDTTLGGAYSAFGAQEASATGTVDFTSSPSMKFTNTFSFSGNGSIAEGAISTGQAASATLVSHVTWSHVSVTASDTFALTYYIEAQQG